MCVAGAAQSVLSSFLAALAATLESVAVAWLDFLSLRSVVFCLVAVLALQAAWATWFEAFQNYQYWFSDQTSPGVP